MRIPAAMHAPAGRRHRAGPASRHARLHPALPACPPARCCLATQAWRSSRRNCLCMWRTGRRGGGTRRRRALPAGCVHRRAHAPRTSATPPASKPICRCSPTGARWVDETSGVGPGRERLHSGRMRAAAALRRWAQGAAMRLHAAPARPTPCPLPCPASPLPQHAAPQCGPARQGGGTLVGAAHQAGPGEAGVRGGLKRPDGLQGKSCSLGRHPHASSSTRLLSWPAAAALHS